MVAHKDKNQKWRKGWDSNPRYHFWHAGFQDQFLKPLGHPSVTEVIIAVNRAFIQTYSLQLRACLCFAYSATVQ